jgi:type IV fimbrial biogenesis protein FimT
MLARRDVTPITLRFRSSTHKNRLSARQALAETPTYIRYMQQRDRFPNHSRGITLLELMLTIAVAAVLAAIAVPNMRDFIRNNRLTSAGNDLLRSLQLARSEAVKRQGVVTVCASDDGETCSDGEFTGWLVFLDANNDWDRSDDEEILESANVSDGVTVVNDATGKVSFAATGFANSTPGQTPASRVVICDVRGNLKIGDNSVARALIIEPTGRARVTKVYDEVESAISTAGSCP